MAEYEKLCGYIDDDDRVSSFDFQHEDGHFQIFKNEEYQDDINALSVLIEYFGDTYFESMDDFKKDNGKSLSAWAKENNFPLDD